MTNPIPIFTASVLLQLKTSHHQNSPASQACGQVLSCHILGQHLAQRG